MDPVVFQAAGILPVRGSATGGMSEEDPHMPKWALDPLLTESSPLQTGRGTEGHGAVDGADEPDSEADYDSDFSDEDMGRVSF